MASEWATVHSESSFAHFFGMGGLRPSASISHNAVSWEHFHAPLVEADAIHVSEQQEDQRASRLPSCSAFRTGEHRSHSPFYTLTNVEQMTSYEMGASRILITLRQEYGKPELRRRYRHPRSLNSSGVGVSVLFWSYLTGKS